MENEKYHIQEYKINIIVKPKKYVYFGTIFINIDNISSSSEIILECHERLRIKSVRQRGVELHFLYNQLNRKLHIPWLNDNINQFAISFECSLEPDEEEEKGLFFMSDSIAVLNIFPNFSHLFIPSISPFSISDISATITVEEDFQTVISSTLCSEIKPLVRNQRSFFFPKATMPLSYFMIVVGYFEKTIIKSEKDTNIILYLDKEMINKQIDDLLNFLKKIIDLIEEKFEMHTKSNNIQIVGVTNFPEKENNSYDIVVFQSNTLLCYQTNLIFIVKQIIKLYFAAFPETYNDYWIIDGMASQFSLYLSNFLINEGISRHADVDKSYQCEFFIPLLNRDIDNNSKSLNEEFNLSNNEDIFDETMFLKSTCLMHMIFQQKTDDDLKKIANLLTFKRTLTFSEFQNTLNINSFLSYIDNPGYPLVIVDDDLTLHQTLFSTSYYTKSNQKTIWSIPLFIQIYKDGQITSKEILFNKTEEKLNIDSDCDWLVINGNCQSICRIWYKGKWLSKIINNFQNIPQTAALNIKCDYTALSQMGLVNKNILNNFNSIEIPPGLTKRFPLIRGNGSYLASLQE